MIKPLNAESVKQRADIVAVLSKYGKVGPLRRGGKAGELVGECPLPGHAKSGKAPGGAFTVTKSTQLFYCFKCGQGGDVFELIKQIEGFTFGQAVQHVAELIGMENDPVLAAGSVKVEPSNGEPVPGGIGASSPRPASAPAVQGKVVATYPYVDENSELLYEVVRYEPKDFKQRQPDGNGGWSWKTAGMRRVLYRLPAVLAADEIYLVEGEKDVHTLEAAGLIATTASGGAKAPWLEEYSETLRGKRVIILPDQDQPGRGRGTVIVAALKGIAASVVVVNVPTGKDLTEYLQSGATVDNLLALVASTREQKQRDEIEARGLLSPEEIFEVFPGGVSSFLQPKHGLKSGFTKFDEMTLGFHPGELTILAARPSVGKTALALNIAVNIAKGGSGVPIFSFEMSRESLLTRVLCSLARVDMLKFRAGYLDEDERYRIQKAIAAACELPLFIDDNAASNLDQMHQKIIRLKDRSGVALVIVDYLQLMRGNSNRENRNQEVSELSRGLKLMARELKVPFLVLSQLSRASEKRPDGHRPQLSDLRDSGSIEQDADLVGFIHREELYKRDDLSVKGMADLIIAKQRNGPIGTIKLLFRHALTQFENYSGAQEVAA